MIVAFTYVFFPLVTLKIWLPQFPVSGPLVDPVVSVPVPNALPLLTGPHN